MVNDFVVTLANSADPDEMLCFAAFIWASLFAQEPVYGGLWSTNVHAQVS